MKPIDTMRIISPIILATTFLYLIGCVHRSAPVNPSGAVTAKYTYLPQKNTRTVTITHDSIVVTRRSQTEKIISCRAISVVDSLRAIVDSVYAEFGQISPKLYKRDGVIDGTVIEISQPDRKLTCDNCLNDYILHAAGKKTVYKTAETELIRSLVESIGKLAEFDDIATMPKRDRVIVQANPASLGKTDSKFSVIYVDRADSNNNKK